MDQALLDRGLVASRTKAQAHIMAREVFVDGRPVDKPGQRVAPDASLEIRSHAGSFASRGGGKLDGALESFAIDVGGMVCLDAGASTGGFTDCLLKRGAARVYAIDVGRGLLDWSLRNDPRVVSMEGVNARYLQPGDLPERVDFATADLSFISLTKVLPALLPLVRGGGMLVPLVKPQFEVGKGQVGRGGVVADAAKHRSVLRTICEFFYNCGVDVIGVLESPLPGPKGNREFFLHGVARTPTSSIQAVLEMAERAAHAN